MITGIIHPGSGLGDQLFCYVVTRVAALDRGYEFGFVGKEFFKGKSFLQLDWGKDSDLPYHIETPAGRLVIDLDHLLFHTNGPAYDPEVNFIGDGVVIDGYGAQDERYYAHRLPEIREWLATEHLFVHPEKCIINFRGGEFTIIPELFLPQEYWNEAIKIMRQKNPDMKLEVHTDDPIRAKEFFPDFQIIQDISVNWRSIRQAHYLIISNSAFAIMPSMLNENVKKIIAPRYWARRNIKTWHLPQNYYKKFTYI